MSFKKRIIKVALLKQLNSLYDDYAPEIEQELTGLEQSNNKTRSILLLLGLVMGSAGAIGTGIDRKFTRSERAAESLETLTKDPSKFIAPVEYTHISSEFGMRTHPVTGEKGKMHKGVDFAAPEGTPVYTPFPGTVERVGWDKTGGGNRVWIKHGHKIKTVYMHLQDYTVKKGDILQAGDLIGHVGSTGTSTGPHLHYGMTFEGEYIDPLGSIPVEPAETLDEELIPPEILVEAEQNSIVSEHLVTERTLSESQSRASLVNEIFDKYDVPHDIADLMIVESNAGLDTRKSSAGARGPWQIISSTGSAYGLKTNDDYYDWTKSTTAAAKILRDYHKIFHNWYLTIMAYNAGPGNVKKYMRNAGVDTGKSSYTMDEVWSVWRQANAETKGYLLKFFNVKSQTTLGFTVNTLLVESSVLTQP